MNDEVKLDNSFKLSFMTDVAKGMDYLHKSHLHSHGNLKSSNCLVDARWTVRVSTTKLLSILNVAAEHLQNCKHKLSGI